MIMTTLRKGTNSYNYIHTVDSGVAVRAQLIYYLITHWLLLTLLASHSHLKASNSCVFAVVSLKSTFFPSTFLQVMVANPYSFKYTLILAHRLF